MHVCVCVCTCVCGRDHNIRSTKYKAHSSYTTDPDTWTRLYFDLQVYMCYFRQLGVQIWHAMIAVTAMVTVHASSPSSFSPSLKPFLSHPQLSLPPPSFYLSSSSPSNNVHVLDRLTAVVLLEDGSVDPPVVLEAILRCFELWFSSTPPPPSPPLS